MYATEDSLYAIEEEKDLEEASISVDTNIVERMEEETEDMVLDIVLLYATEEKKKEASLSIDAKKEASLSIDAKDANYAKRKREEDEEIVEEVVQNTTKKKRTPKKGAGKKALIQPIVSLVGKPEPDARKIWADTVLAIPAREMRQWLPKVRLKTRFIPVRIKSAGALHGNSGSCHIVPKDADNDSSGEEGAEEASKGGFQHNVKIPKFKMKTGHENHLNLRRKQNKITSKQYYM